MNLATVNVVALKMLRVKRINNSDLLNAFVRLVKADEDAVVIEDEGG